MATSPYDDTVFVLDFLGKLIWEQEATILDVGAGFGRWGFLLRCHLGFGKSLTAHRPQRLTIDAIESFAGNTSPIYECVYDQTFQDDAASVLPGLGRYDVIICSHVIEHFEKAQGLKFLDEMVMHATKAVIIGLPFGECPQEEYDGNSFEVHRSTWVAGDFDKYHGFIKRYGQNGLVIIPRSEEARWHTRMMANPLRRLAFKVIRKFRQRA
jgi:hypothetical protein